MSKYSEKKERQARERIEEERRLAEEATKKAAKPQPKKSKETDWRPKRVPISKVEARDLVERAMRLVGEMRKAGLKPAADVFEEVCQRYCKWNDINFYNLFQIN